MASIFTYNPDVPRVVSSPWTAAQGQHTSDAPLNLTIRDLPQSLSGIASRVSITRLEAEPQEGPVEYKLHLLLRPRRRLVSSTTGKWIAGSQHARSDLQYASGPGSSGNTGVSSKTEYAGSRQHRLEQLTTQLLWRLQQSSPYHSSSADNLILPSLPEATPQLDADSAHAKLLPGLEDSRGALYEVGVADDGSLVGLTEGEMSESLGNLGAMAGSLGCEVIVLRMAQVGECEYFENEDIRPGMPASVAQKGKLYVAEAYVKPSIKSRETASTSSSRHPSMCIDNGGFGDPVENHAATSDKEQLRVSFTGATTSGKSSLLGTLSTSTLDNGRGKSRLSLLKHRHEIASGMTSSVAQELVGYNDKDDASGGKHVHVVNYATGNVSSWDDIHASAASGRLAFLCDSAGHPRFRRTTVRGLVGWAPHWTLMCMAANTNSETLVQDSPTLLADNAPTAASISSIAMAHLALCLKLSLPIVILITKFDAATKPLLRQVLTEVLTQLKTAGRTPIMISNDNRTYSDEDLQTIPTADDEEISRVCGTLQADPISGVPILFTSAVRGTGLGKLHALLRRLPVVVRPHTHVENGAEQKEGEDDASMLFNIDDTFNMHAKHSGKQPEPSMNASNTGIIISGHLAAGRISVGDELLLGPFSWHSAATATKDAAENDVPTIPTTRRSLSTPPETDSFLSPRSFIEALRLTTTTKDIQRRQHDRTNDVEHNTWLPVRITSIRNLRLPVLALQTDQAGTLGVVHIHDGVKSLSPSDLTDVLPIRKGMVLLPIPTPAANADTLAGKTGLPLAAQSFTAAFGIADAGAVVVGGIVIVYSAAVRAAGKVVAVALAEAADSAGGYAESGDEGGENDYDDDDDEGVDGFGFALDGDADAEDVDDELGGAGGVRLGGDRAAVEEILVTVQFLTYREWIKIGAKVLIMPGGGSGTTGMGFGNGGGNGGGVGVEGLEGFVGRVVEKFG